MAARFVRSPKWAVMLFNPTDAAAHGGFDREIFTADQDLSVANFRNWRFDNFEMIACGMRVGRDLSRT